jgi:hypothetical protein
MADFRKVKCSMWRSDEWFQELPTDARLLWIYLFTNASTSVAGIYKIPLKTVAFESGLSVERIRELLVQFGTDRKAYYDNGVLWVVKMREIQGGDPPGDTVLKCIAKDLSLIPYGDLKQRYLIHYGYPMDTLPGDRDRDRDVDRDRDQTETEAETRKPATAAAVKAFENVCGVLPDGVVLEQIKATIDELSAIGHPEWWQQALDEAVANNARKWAYIRTITDRCLREGKPPGSNKGARRNGSTPETETAEQRAARYIPQGYEDLIEH